MRDDFLTEGSGDCLVSLENIGAQRVLEIFQSVDRSVAVRSVHDNIGVKELANPLGIFAVYAVFEVVFNGVEVLCIHMVISPEILREVAVGEWLNKKRQSKFVFELKVFNLSMGSVRLDIFYGGLCYS